MNCDVTKELNDFHTVTNNVLLGEQIVHEKYGELTQAGLSG